MIPVVHARSACIVHRFEMRHAIFQLDTFFQLLNHRRGQIAKNTCGIHAQQLLRGVHHAVCQLAVIGHNQQAGGIEIQTPYGNPASVPNRRQAFKHRRAAFWVKTCGQFAFRLVIHQYPTSKALDPRAHRLAANFHTISWQNACAQRGHFAINLDLTRLNPLLNRPTRAQAPARQYLL